MNEAVSHPQGRLPPRSAPSAAVHFLPLELAKWSASPADALVLPIFSDVRPLRGAAGLADWRLCGRISRMLKSGRVGGKNGETILFPPSRARLPFSRILLFGVGEAAGFQETAYIAEAARIRAVLKNAGLSSYAIQLPGRCVGSLSAARSLELWLDIASSSLSSPSPSMDELATVLFIDTPAGQREMTDVLRRRRGL